MREVRGSRGFTFIEAVVALTIMAIAITAVSLLYVSGYRQYARENDRIEVQENLRLAAARMAGKIRQADPGSISITDSGRQIGFTLSFSAEKFRYQFDAQDKEVEEVKEGPSGYTQPVASYITGLNFSRSGNGVTIVVEGKKGHSGEVRLSTEVSLRVGESG